jgi:hypothetical protein
MPAGSFLSRDFLVPPCYTAAFVSATVLLQGFHEDDFTPAGIFIETRGAGLQGIDY